MTLPPAAIVDVDGSLVDVSSVRHHVDGSHVLKLRSKRGLPVLVVPGWPG